MRTYQLKDFANAIAVSVTDPANSGYDKFVGLEHYDSRDLVVKRFSGVEMLTTTAKEFKKNDILIARRNVYLRRAGIAIFDGITSGDSIVLRVKEDCENTTGVSVELAQRILPLVVNSEDFWSYANKHADGMNSKRISKEMLLDYEFSLPPIEEQKVLADKLWAAYEVKQSYLNMIDATNQMVKAKFVEMFGDPMKSKQKYPIRKLGDCCKINPKRPIISLTDLDLISFVPMTSVSENGYLQDVKDVAYGQVKKGFTYFENDDVLFAKITPCMENGKGAIATSLTNGIGMGSTEYHVLRPIKDISNSFWLLCLTRLPAFRKKAQQSMTGTGGQLRVNATYLTDFPVGLPPIVLQQEFANIYTQAETSIAHLNDSIAAIDRVIRSLINENL